MDGTPPAGGRGVEVYFLENEDGTPAVIRRDETQVLAEADELEWCPIYDDLRSRRWWLIRWRGRLWQVTGDLSDQGRQNVPVAGKHRTVSEADACRLLVERRVAVVPAELAAELERFAPPAHASGGGDGGRAAADAPAGPGGETPPREGVFPPRRVAWEGAVAEFGPEDQAPYDLLCRLWPPDRNRCLDWKSFRTDVQRQTVAKYVQRLKAVLASRLPLMPWSPAMVRHAGSHFLVWQTAPVAAVRRAGS